MTFGVRMGPNVVTKKTEIVLEQLVLVCQKKALKNNLPKMTPHVVCTDVNDFGHFRFLILSKTISFQLFQNRQ